MAQKIILAKTARPELAEYIESLGCEVELFGPIGTVQAPLGCHPDMLHCRLDRDTVYTGDPARLGPDYPHDIIYNACSTGKYFIHNLRYTAPELLEAADRLGLVKVNVSQGYAKCSICVVGPEAIITYDRGVAKMAASAGLDVLTIEPGHVELPGYSTGFIGGATGLVQNINLPDQASGVANLATSQLELANMATHSATAATRVANMATSPQKLANMATPVANLANQCANLAMHIANMATQPEKLANMATSQHKLANMATFDAETCQSGNIAPETCQSGNTTCQNGNIVPDTRPILIFNGDLSAHPDARAIMDFAEEHGVRVKYFSGWKLTDIGSII